LERVAVETNVSKEQARLALARKMRERSRLKQKRRKQQERLRKQAKDLETTEAEILLVDHAINQLESAVDEGTDGESQ